MTAPDRPTAETTWARMPTRNGPHWFTKDLKDRDLSQFVGVSRVEYGDGSTHFETREGAVIGPGWGWWLLIPDHRKTAHVPETHHDA